MSDGGAGGAGPTAAVQVIVPDWASPPECPTGGDRYNERICRELAAAGWSVRVHAVTGDWPWPDPAARHVLSDAFDAIPDGAMVLADGIVTSAASEITAAHAGRLSLTVLVHLPLGEQFPSHRVDGAAESERRALTAARSVITTSGFTRARLLDRYRLPGDSVVVVVPGCDPAPHSPGTPDGGEILCVATVSPHKGQDVLLDALGLLADRRWHLRIVGPLRRDPAFVARVRARAAAPELAGRVEIVGALEGPALRRAFAAADLLVVPSRADTYAMVVTEALTRGLPVIGSDVGGIPEALGRTPDGRRPGMLVPAEDPASLAGALGRWLDSPSLRRDLREAARGRRIPGWPDAGRAVARVLLATAPVPAAVAP